MNVDHFFSIGAAHLNKGEPCEDYALSGVLAPGVVFGVVADGCSGAKANTDVGARAISWAFRNSLVQRVGEVGGWFGPGFHDLLKKTFESYRFSHTRADYQATLIGFVSDEEKTSIIAHGDGAVAIKYLDGRIKLIQFSWVNNSPMYLNYQTDAQWFDDYVEKYTEVGFPFLVKESVVNEVAEVNSNTKVTTMALPISDVIGGFVMTFEPNVEQIASIAILTDGIEKLISVEDVDSDGVSRVIPNEHVAGEVLAYKTFAGTFLKRRMLRALRNYEKAGFVPQDDIGVAAVWFGGVQNAQQ